MGGAVLVRRKQRIEVEHVLAGALAPIRNYLSAIADSAHAHCPDCGGLWPDFCSCPDRDDEVEARDEANRETE